MLWPEIPVAVLNASCFNLIKKQVPTEAYVVLKDSCQPHGHTFRLRAWLTGQNNKVVVAIIQQKC